MATERRKWMDPDFRRDSKTSRFCVMCQRDLSPSQPAREVRFELDRYEAIDPEDWALFPQAESGLLGMDCAKRLGLEWSVQS